MKRNVNHILLKFFFAVAFVSVPGFFSGCKSLVLEDRSLCPNRVILQNDPSVDPEVWGYMKLNLWKDWEEDSEEIVRMDELNQGHPVVWRKEHLFEVTAITGWNGTVEGDGLYLIPLGNECPDAVGGYARSMVGRDETYYVTLPIRSLYANVFLEIEGASSRYEFKAVIRGAVDGYSLPSLRLHEGTFECETRELSYEMRAARIPRQDEPSNMSTKTVYAAGLKTDFYFQEQGSIEWERFYTLPLGEIITQNGYDWSKPVLDDIHVKIRLADGAITRLVIEVDDWQVVVIGEGSSYVI